MLGKSRIRAGLGAVLTLVITLSLAACGATAGADPAVPVAADAAGAEAGTAEAVSLAGEAAASGVTGGTSTTDAAVVNATPDPSGLSGEEIESLYWMREEEKLARDVYLALFEAWGQPIFENIAASESRHMDAVLGLINTYGLDDPVRDDTPGVFTDPELAALYDELVERGSVSLVEALSAGALIEDLDIRDLEESLALTERPDIVRVYSSLQRGSQNHLRAFTSRLAAAGAEYEPVYHSEEEFAALLAGAAGSRPRGRGRSAG